MGISGTMVPEQIFQEFPAVVVAKLHKKALDLVLEKYHEDDKPY